MSDTPHRYWWLQLPPRCDQQSSSSSFFCRKVWPTIWHDLIRWMEFNRIWTFLFVWTTEIITNWSVVLQNINIPSCKLSSFQLTRTEWEETSMHVPGRTVQEAEQVDTCHTSCLWGPLLIFSPCPRRSCPIWRPARRLAALLVCQRLQHPSVQNAKATGTKCSLKLYWIWKHTLHLLDSPLIWYEMIACPCLDTGRLKSRHASRTNNSKPKGT